MSERSFPASYRNRRTVRKSTSNNVCINHLDVFLNYSEGYFYLRMGVDVLRRRWAVVSLSKLHFPVELANLQNFAYQPSLLFWNVVNIEPRRTLDFDFPIARRCIFCKLVTQPIFSNDFSTNTCQWKPHVINLFLYSASIDMIVSRHRLKCIGSFVDLMFCFLAVKGHRFFGR